MDSIFLPYCWICNVPFQGLHPNGTVPEHRHHMVPRAFGGVDGPQVSLCSDDHNTLHQIAVTWKASKSHFKYIQNKPLEVVKKLEYLASIVYNAELRSRNDPNKLASVILHLDAKQKHQIDSLKKLYNKRGRKDILELALANLYNKHFMSK